jgi:hypothetical protein
MDTAGLPSRSSVRRRSAKRQTIAGEIFGVSSGCGAVHCFEPLVTQPDFDLSGIRSILGILKFCLELGIESSIDLCIDRSIEVLDISLRFR